MPHGNFDVDFMIMSNFQPAINVKAPSLEGSTLVVPLVSLGNCPQLAGDLLLETLALKLKGESFLISV